MTMTAFLLLVLALAVYLGCVFTVFTRLIRKACQTPLLRKMSCVLSSSAFVQH